MVYTGAIRTVLRPSVCETKDTWWLAWDRVVQVRDSMITSSDAGDSCRQIIVTDAWGAISVQAHWLLGELVEGERSKLCQRATHGVTGDYGIVIRIRALRSASLVPCTDYCRQHTLPCIFEAGMRLTSVASALVFTVVVQPPVQISDPILAIGRALECNDCEVAHMIQEDQSARLLPSCIGERISDLDVGIVEQRTDLRSAVQVVPSRVDVVGGTVCGGTVLGEELEVVESWRGDSALVVGA